MSASVASLQEFFARPAEGREKPDRWEHPVALVEYFGSMSEGKTWIDGTARPPPGPGPGPYTAAHEGHRAPTGKRGLHRGPG